MGAWTVVKDFVEFLVALVTLCGLLTTGFAYWLNKRHKRLVRQQPPGGWESMGATNVVETAEENPFESPSPVSQERYYAKPPVDSGLRERALIAVRGPAVLMLVFGLMGVAVNVALPLLAWIGYATETEEAPDWRRPPAHRSVGMGPNRPSDSPWADDSEVDDETSLALFSVLCLGVAALNVAGVLGAIQMMRLRSYWLAVAGSLAVMPGSCCCLFLGVIAGVWSLAVLLSSDVSRAFT